MGSTVCKPRSVAIIGGGLAGLAVTYHLMELTKHLDESSPCTVMILDEAEVGEGGASGAMGGLLHPLTPRGKKLWMVRMFFYAERLVLSSSHT